ncbi:MAG: efflux RND transporter permease subunit [Lentisphaeria bacterium]|nr:efflux RND transporter permease subunit [Lentisphaeria bacterium]
MIRFFAGHPTAANLLMALFMIVGLLSLPNILRETMPDFAPSEVEIRIPYPGATAEEVEETVARRVEDAIDDVNYVREIRSDSREGLSITVVEMDEDGDFQSFFNDIERGIDAIDDFPAAVEDPVIAELGRTDLVMGLLVSGPLSVPDLKTYSEDLKDRMRETGLALIDVEGFSEHQLRVSLNEAELRRAGLSAPLVADAIAAQSRDTPLGMIETRERDILLRFTDQRRTPDELAALVVWAGPRGAEIRLGEIAVIEDLFELDEQKIMLNGNRCALLNIRKTKAEDTLRIAERARAFIADEQLRYPRMSFTVSQDESLILADRLDMLVANGVQGLILVFLVMWVFFNIRVSFWVAMGLPVSFLGAFLIAPRLGLSVNMFTMVGLLLALGILMDDAIVIAENIAAHRRRGKGPLEAAIEGTKEVAAGVFSSFITTICVLGPLAFIGGQIGRVLRVVPMILLLVLAVSLIEAFVILPAHLNHAMHHFDPNRPGRVRRRFDALIEWLRHNLAGRVVAVLLRRRYWVFSAVLALFILSLGMLASGRIKVQGFPELEGDVVVARLLMPQGTPLARTEQTIARLLEALEETNAVFAPRQPDGRRLIENAYVQFSHNVEAFESGPHVATITVDLLSAEERTGAIDSYLADWRHRIGALPDSVSLTLAEPGFGPGGRPIEVRLRGRDLDELKTAARELHDWFGQYEGVVNLADDLRPGKPELRLRMREDAHGIGITAAAVARQLRGAFQGLVADEIQIGSESYEIDVRLAKVDRDSLSALDNFMLVLADGSETPLRSVATWEETRGWARVGRFNRMRAVTLYGDVDTRLVNTNELMGVFRKTYLPDFRRKHPDIKLAIAGEIEETGRARKSMLAALGIGMIGIFVLLSFQFRTYTEPLIVMIAIPFSLIGVVWGHALMGVPISMPSLLGFIALAGIVVNDSILLVIFLKNARAQGVPLAEAAAGASRDRFRAVLLTSSTTVAGLLPILLERSLQAQILKPLVISTAFGLIASTLLVLLALPCMYMILGDLGWIEKTAPNSSLPE